MITLRGLSRVALFLTLGLAIVSPALPQGSDAKDWQAVQDQKDQKKKADLLEAFIKKYPTSNRRPDSRRHRPVLLFVHRRMLRQPLRQRVRHRPVDPLPFRRP